MYRVILFGPQGSGKGTQAELLALKLNVSKIDTGNLWRKEIAEGTSLGRAQAQRQSEGKLALDDQTNEVMRRRLSADDVKEGFLIDGYPRSRAQLEALDTIAPPTHVIFLKLRDEEALRRLTGRLFCKTCGKTYHASYNPPKVKIEDEWLCDEDRTPLIVREDDKPESIKQRLEIYHEQSEPIVQIYRPRGILYEIDASQSIEKVHEDIMQVLRK
ncbi:MAG: nucleoside monophosphate kinase [bacterium]|nr:nucleoside monophosphate kinase [bacterium]